RLDGPQERWLVLGDSKADALYYGLARHADPGTNWVLIGGLSPWRMADWGEPVVQRLLADPQLKGVVLVSAMRGLMKVDRNTGRPLAEPDLATQDAWLQDYERFTARWLERGTRVVVVRDHPTLPDPNDCIEGEMTSVPVLRQLLRRSPNRLCTQTLTDHMAWSRTYDRVLQNLQARPPAVQVYSPLHLLCDAGQDRCPMVRDGAFLYSYGDHLSDTSNSLIAKDLLGRMGLPARAEPAEDRSPR
ncbi:MAG: SGNH hydrolase domain-containing protein, partial [Limnohabitans sp.]